MWVHLDVEYERQSKWKNMQNKKIVAIENKQVVARGRVTGLWVKQVMEIIRYMLPGTK